MAGPYWLAAAFAAVMIVTAAYCAGRLAASRRWRRATELDADALHLVMGIAMAGMLLPALDPLPTAVSGRRCSGSPRCGSPGARSLDSAGSVAGPPAGGVAPIRYRTWSNARP